MIKKENQKIKIENYSFEQFNNFDSSFKEYEFHDFNKKFPDLTKKNLGITEDKIRKERVSAKTSNFEITPEVQKLRGLNKQENDDFEKKVKVEVSQKISVLKTEAEKDGFQKGFEAGQEKAYQEARVYFSQKIDEFSQELEQVRDLREQVLAQEIQDAYILLRNLAKWIALKEVDEDNKYISRLLERLILELNEKKNLLVRVNAKYFQGMEEVLQEVQQKVGKLTNVRVEVDQELEDKGIILESDKGIIDGSLKAQFETFQKIFESVGLSGNDSQN